jgi:hypothetical protein
MVFSHEELWNGAGLRHGTGAICCGCPECHCFKCYCRKYHNDKS